MVALVLIRGPLGAGKTMLAAGLTRGDPRPVLANFHIEHPHFRELEPEDLHDIRKPTLVIIDEAYTWLEARLSGKPVTIYLGYIMFQARKRGMDIILTCQLGSTIDKRFRAMATLIIDCRREGDWFIYTFHHPGKRSLSFGLHVTQAQQFWKYYDSYAPVDPIDDELLYKVTSQEKRLSKVDATVDDMLKVAKPEQWTQGTVEAYLQENHLPHAEAKSVYNRIKFKMLTGTGTTLRTGKPVPVPRAELSEVAVLPGSSPMFNRSLNKMRCKQTLGSPKVRDRKRRVV
jgi:hypothetical protein